MDINYFRKVVEKIHHIPDDEWQKMAPHCNIKTYSKNDFILRCGEYSPYLGLIIDGLVKRTLTHHSGKEFVHYFGRKDQMIGAFTSILKKEPARVDIQAIKETHVLHFNYEKYQELFDSHSCWERISRVLLENHFIIREEREFQLLSLNANERYKAFIKEHADCINDLTSKDIASFLRITPEAFSRLKKNNS